MYSKIQKLGDDLINKIAAGEVVERPASVVKELVENSLDAGATRIEVNIKDGGKKLIQVIDNGRGINEDELELAISRHASSKIETFDDIYSLTTKGFRGEALASICSVAKVSLASNAGKDEGQEILIEGGKVIDKHVCAHTQGTTVTVKYLFYQTPARLKFLKTSATETSHIENIITKLALCHPDVGFVLRKETNTLLEVPAAQNDKDRMVSILGADLADYLYSFEANNQGLSLHGFLGHPQMARSQRSFCFFFVNKRPVSDKVLWHAAMEAYRDLLMRGKYPILVLNLNIDEKLVDVNVHPTKSEVRFHQSGQIHHFVYHALRKRLEEAPWMEGDEAQGSGLRAQDTGYRSQDSGRRIQEPVTCDLEPATNELWPTTNLESSTKSIQFGKTPYSEMQPIGQVMGTYILCEAHEKLFIIDQHAAHERIGFEKLLKQYEKEGVPCSPLLIPETFDLKPSDTEILKNYLEEITKFGFEIDYFGGQTFVVKSLPKLFEGKIDIIKFVQDLVEDIKETGELVSLKDRRNEVLTSISCHAQIRAGHHLEPEEISALLKELDEYPFSEFCPHGRPACVEVSKYEIEKWFRRVV